MCFNFKLKRNFVENPASVKTGRPVRSAKDNTDSEQLGAISVVKGIGIFSLAVVRLVMQPSSAPELTSPETTLSTTPPPRPCSACLVVPATFTCGGCGSVGYCGIPCQRSLWSSHKPICREISAARSRDAKKTDPDVVKKVTESVVAVLMALSGNDREETDKILAALGANCEGCTNCAKPCKNALALGDATKNPTDSTSERVVVIESLIFCTSCRIAHYCSEKCKAAHAPIHEKPCIAYSNECFKNMKAEVEAGRGGASELADLAQAYMLGNHMTPPNPELAFKYFYRAAQKGHVLSQYSVGRRYHMAEGVDKNVKLACQWYLLAGENGATEAYHNLGNLHQSEGRFESAVKYWRLAAAATPPVAISFLALAYAYEKGQGARQSDAEAARYFELGAKSVGAGSQDYMRCIMRLNDMQTRGVLAAHNAMNRLQPQGPKADRRRARARARYRYIEFVEGEGFRCIDYLPGEPDYEAAMARYNEKSSSEDEEEVA